MKSNLIKSRKGVVAVNTVSSRIKCVAAILLVAVIAMSGCASSKNPSVYAIVNGQEITRADYMAYENFFRLAQPELVLSRDEQKQILEDLINLNIFDGEADKRGITVDTEAVQTEYESYRSQLLKLGHFEGSMAIYYNRLLELDLSENWILQLLGKYNKVNIMVEAEQAQVETPSPQAIQKYYDQNKQTLYSHGELRKTRHILINAGNFPDDYEGDTAVAAQELAEELHQRLMAGEDFAALAEAYSQDGSASMGGDLGFLEKSDVIKEFGDVAFSLDLDVVSQPVKSEYGWHLIEVLEIKEAGFYELDEELTVQISSQLYDAELKDVADKLWANLNDEAEVVIKFK